MIIYLAVLIIAIMSILFGITFYSLIMDIFNQAGEPVLLLKIRLMLVTGELLAGLLSLPISPIRMKLLTNLICICFLVSCSTWSKTDRALLGTAITLRAVDYLQTKKLVKDPEHYEQNPILGENPKQNTIDLYFLTTAIGLTIIADKLSPKWRKHWLIGFSLISGTCVVHNFSIGIRF